MIFLCKKLGQTCFMVKTSIGSVQVAIPYLADDAGGGIGGDSERSGQFNFTETHADLAVLHLEVDDLFVVDPRFQLLLRYA